jgi:Na+/alanine symporter
VFRDIFSIRTRFADTSYWKCFVCCLTVKVQNLSFFFKHYQCHWQVVVGGNIAGVATAIALEDRSSILMWMVAFLASTAFVEATLAQIYKEKHLGEFRGGPFFISRED